MIDLIQTTNDPELARRCDALAGMWLCVDLEVGPQAGRDRCASSHTPDDVGRIKAVLRQAPLVVRVNPLHPATRAEVDAALAQGADWLMLPGLARAEELRAFCALVAGRAPVVALLETATAFESVAGWIGAPGLHQVQVDLGGLQRSLGLRCLFEPLALGLLDSIARVVHAQGLRLGFGGSSRLAEGPLSAPDVLAEHLRLGAQALLLPPTQHGDDAGAALQAEVSALRATEQALLRRDARHIEADRQRIAAIIGRGVMAARGNGSAKP